MKFYGHGVVWDASKNKPLCRFNSDGEFETKDKYIISRLLDFDYKHGDYDKTIEKYLYTEAELKIMQEIELEKKNKPEEHLFVIEGSLSDEEVEKARLEVENERTKTNGNNGTPKRKSNRRTHNDRK